MKIFKMSSNKIIRILIIVGLYFFYPSIYGQKKQDSLQSQTVTVVKSYTPTVRDADKQLKNPLMGTEVFEKLQVEYNPIEIEAVSTFETEKGRLVKPYIQSEKYKNIPGYVEFAAGNQKAFRLNAFYSHLFDNDWKTTAELKFFNLGNTQKDSLQLAPFSDFNTWLGFSNTNTDRKWLFGLNYSALRSSYRDTLTPFSVLGKTFVNHFAGVNVTGEFFEGVFENISLKYDYLSGYAGYEHSVNLKSVLRFPVSGFDIYTVLHGALVSGSGGSGYNNLQGGLSPSFRVEKERFLFKLGFKLFIQNRTDLNDAVLFYPDISAEYNMVPELLTLYLKYEGDMKTKSYHELIGNNRYVSIKTPLNITTAPYLFEGGFKGAVGSQMSYLLSLGMSQEKKSVFLQLDKQPEGLVFKPVYDNLDYFYFKINLSYVANENFETKLKFDYYQFSPQTIQKAWNREDYKVSWLMKIRSGKFGLRSDLYYLGPKYNLLEGNVVKSGETLDLNLKLSYRIMKGLYVYAEGNNLLNRNDYYYYAYPLHGLHILAGLTYSFN